ncbi:helix-turn-helix transcriptional regulator [Achromobacter sp. F4_2707]|uniref:helix-turn-helix domain-containing protein n=1 Tax=Achromobacter sp. F4_2707 TaxID=3114286 RepID=UPI0039C64D1D
MTTKSGKSMPKKSQKAAGVSMNGTASHAHGNSKKTDDYAHVQPVVAPAVKVETLKDLRKATRYTQDDLALAMGVGQGTVSRIEKRRDMLVSTLQHYVEGMGGKLQILATFPNRQPLAIESLGSKTTRRTKARKRKSAETGSSRQSVP